MKNMKLAYKLIMAFMVVALLAAAVGFVGNYGIEQVYGIQTRLYEKNVVPTPYLSEMKYSVSKIREEIRTAALFYDQLSKVQIAESQMKTQKAIFLQNRDLYRATIENETELAKFDDACTIFDDSFYPICESIMEYSKAGNISAARNALLTAADFTNVMLDNLEESWDAALVHAQALHEESNQTRAQMGLLILVAAVGGFVLAALLGIFVARGVSRPVNEMAIAAGRIADGILDIQVGKVGNDEVGQLAASLQSACTTLKLYISDISNHLSIMGEGDFSQDIAQSYIGDFAPIKEALEEISQNMNRTMSIIHLSAEQVNMGAEQLSGGAQQLAMGATHQASSIEELSASINEVSDKVHKNSQNVALASQYVREAGEGVSYSNAQMEKMLEAMRDINRSSMDIQKIIKTIDDIAFQTNILALNAAVEAARAGSAGRGFAVVAEEVRNLAVKSAEAASQTTSLIEDSIQKVRAGSQIADETANALLGVVEKTTLVQDTTQLISDASREQDEAITQILMGIEQISTVVQTNSATAQQSAAASEELSGQAAILRNEISGIKLRAGAIEAHTKGVRSDIGIVPVDEAFLPEMEIDTHGDAPKGLRYSKY